jgi:pimeloyl-ACP methyl ester carboxylesterase
MSVALRRAGFEVRRFRYHSVRADLVENAARLQDYLRRIDAPVIHLVGHSLGGIVIRALFHWFPDQRPGRVVTLGSPHAGSHVGALLQRYRVGRVVTGRSIAQLAHGTTQQWTMPADREIGVIMGTRSLGLGMWIPGLAQPNDGVVSVEEAQWPAARATLHVPLAHSGMLVSMRVAGAVAGFLRDGRFDPDA